MDEFNMFSILKKLLSKEELSGLSGIVVVEDHDGYVMFNDFKITPKNGHYDVTRFYTHCKQSFCVLKNAVVWCTLVKRKKVAEANLVALLDNMLDGAMANEQVHQHLYTKTQNRENKMLYYSKLQEDKAKKRRLQQQLNDYAREVKLWQYQQFSAVK